MTPTIGVGQPAPDFALRDQHGKTVSLGDFRGRRLVVVFYPLAFSSVCSGELAQIQDGLDALQDEATAVIAISCDAMFSLRVFADRDGLTFPLLSDFWPHGATAQAYGVFDADLGIADRATYIIDREGIVRWTVRNEISNARDLTDYHRVLRELAITPG